MKAKVSLRYFLNDCLSKDISDSNSIQIPLNLISLAILVTWRRFAEFWFKIRAIKLQKSPQICLLDNCFSDIFTGAKICS